MVSIFFISKLDKNRNSFIYILYSKPTQTQKLLTSVRPINSNILTTFLQTFSTDVLPLVQQIASILSVPSFSAANRTSKAKASSVPASKSTITRFMAESCAFSRAKHIQRCYVDIRKFPLIIFISLQCDIRSYRVCPSQLSLSRILV